MKVLLVTTDQRISSQVHTALVGEADLELVEARTPGRALALLDEGETYDVLVADSDTAPTGGMALSRDVKARQRMGHECPPVVLLIARLQDRWLAEWAEADAWIHKPVDPFDLSAVVHALAEGVEVPALPRVGRGGGPMREDAKEIERSIGEADGMSGLGTATGP